MKNTNKLLLYSIAINLILLMLFIISMVIMKHFIVKNQQTNAAILAELSGVKTKTASNGSQIAYVRTIVVTHDQLKAIDKAMGRQLSKRLDDMEVKFNRKLESITLANIHTIYNIRDSFVVTTDSTYETHYSELPWIQFDHYLYPDYNYSTTMIDSYDSIAWATRNVWDTTYGWPGRYFRPKVTELILNNYNPHSRIGYVRQYKKKGRK